MIRVIDDTDDEMRDGETLHVRLDTMDDAMFVRRSAFDAADLADHAPGFRVDNERYLRAYAEYCRDAGHSSERVSDAVVRASRTAWIADMQRAWRMDARATRPASNADDDADANNDEPEGSTGQYNRQYKARGKIGRSALSHEVDSRDAREAARDAYVRRLTDAWRTPVGDAAEPDLSSRPSDPRAPSGVTDPGAAENIEEQVERVRGRAWNEYRGRLESAWRSPPGVMPPQRAQVAVGPSSTIAGVASSDPAVRTRRVSSGPGPVSMVRERKR